MKEKIEFKIISGKRPQIEEEIADHLNNGWALHGPLTHVLLSSSGLPSLHYYQAMVKEERQSEMDSVLRHFKNEK